MYVLRIESIVAVTLVGFRLSKDFQINVDGTVLSFSFCVAYKRFSQPDNHPRYFHGHCVKEKISWCIRYSDKSLSVSHETKQKNFRVAELCEWIDREKFQLKP